MSDELTPPPQPAPDEPFASGHRGPGVGLALLVILLTTLPLIGLLYLGHRLLNLPFVPFDLYDWLIRTGVSPWIALVDVLNGSQAAGGGNIAQSAPLVQWLLSLGLFILLALAIGLSFYAFVLRRGRLPDLIDGLVVAAIFAACSSSRAFASASITGPTSVESWPGSPTESSAIAPATSLPTRC